MKKPKDAKSFVIPTRTRYVIAIKSKETVSISCFVISDITPSQWNFYLANIHTWTAFHISKLISGRKKKKQENPPQQTKKPPGMLSLSKITSLGKDTITLEVSVDDWLGMQITEKEYHRLGGLDNTSPINNSKFIVVLKHKFCRHSNCPFMQAVKLQLPMTVSATFTGKNKIKLRFPAQIWCYWRITIMLQLLLFNSNSIFTVTKLQ